MSHEEIVNVDDDDARQAVADVLVEKHLVHGVLLEVCLQQSACHLSGPCSRGIGQSVDVAADLVEARRRGSCSPSDLVLGRQEVQVIWPLISIRKSLKKGRGDVSGPKRPLDAGVLHVAVCSCGIYGQQGVL